VERGGEEVEMMAIGVGHWRCMQMKSKAVAKAATKLSHKSQKRARNRNGNTNI